MKEKGISKGFFVWAYALSVGLSLVTPHLIHVRQDWLKCAPRLLSYTSAIAGLLGLVIFVVFVFKVWVAIQDGHARTSAGKAAGFLLIPFFNIYWLFQAIWGFAKDYNRFLDRHGICASKLPAGLYLAFSILISTRVLYRTIATLKPITGVGTLLGPHSYFLTIPVFVFGIIVIYKSCEAVNALPEPAEKRAL